MQIIQILKKTEDGKLKLMVVKNLENFIVISTPDVLLICPRDEKQIKAITADLAINNLSDYL